jgi:hypothetical protein
VQQLLSQLRQLATQLPQECGARQLANIIWACGCLRDVDTYTLLLHVFSQPNKLQEAEPQHVSNMLLAAEALQLLPTTQQLQLVLQRFCKELPRASPQAVSKESESVSNWMLHRTSPVWGANKRLIGQSNSKPDQKHFWFVI